MDKALSLSKQFFAKPVEEKVEVEWESFVGKRGFVMKGRHLNTLAFQVRSLMISIDREQIFNLDDMLVLRHDGKFNKPLSMKLHQSIKESYELGRIPSLNQFPRDGPNSKSFGSHSTLPAINCTWM